jgi:uncharacterized BrkB/YihY/UPF0761 family membrane protein
LDNSVTASATALAPYPALTTLLSITITIVVLISLMVWLRRHEGAEHIDTPRVALSLIVVMTFIGVTVYATLRPVPENEWSGQLVGALISGFTIVLSYWFGVTRAANGYNGQNERPPP